MKSAVKIRLLSLGLAATLAAASSSFAQPRDDAGSSAGSSYVSQYCAPKDEETPNSRRLYC